MKKGGGTGARGRAAPPPTRASKPAGPAAALAMPPTHDGNMTVPTLMRMQADAGNAATAAMVGRHLPAQRLADATAPPVAPPGLRADQDPAFAAVRGKVGVKGRALKQHPPASGEAAKARAAAEPPANDKDSQAKDARLAEMGEAKAGTFDKAAFIAAVRAAVESSAPKTLEEADDFAGSGKAGEIKGQVTGQVAAGKEATTGDVKAKTAAPPDPSVAVEKQVTPMQPPAPVRSASVPAAGAMPRPAPPEQLDLDGAKHETDGSMAQAGVTEGQLAASNEPEFQDALSAKKEGEQHSATAPGELRAAEAPLLAQTRAGASSSAAQALGAMVASKRGGNARVGASKSAAKSNEENERRQVATQIEGIFASTKRETEAILAGIDPLVETEFTKGEADARAAFETSQSTQMKAWKDERYDGAGGALRWGWDKIKGPPAKVNEFFARAREIYVAKLGESISRIADAIARELARARERITKGKNDVKAFAAQQKGNLAKYAAEAEESIGGRFDELEQSVEDKQGELVDSLAAKYNEAQGAIDERISALQAENMGLWDRAKAAVGGAIKTILKLKDMLFSVFARAVAAVEKIITDPIGFLGKMVSAVKAGLDLFISKLPKHLADGLQGWLFGAMGEAGIEIPSTFDAKGILKMVLSMIGATAATVRSMIVKRIGQPAMDALERGGGFVVDVMRQAAGGTWDFIVDKVGDIKSKVMGTIQKYVQEKVIMAGLTWLLSLLNPAAAFIKACKAIYDLVMFFVEKGEAIKEIMDSVIDSIEEVLSGGVGKVAQMIEQTLAKAVPVLIGLLASLLNLGGIGEKVRNAFDTVRKPVKKAIGFVVDKAVKLGKGVLARIKRSKLGQAVAKGKAKVKAGVAKVKAGVAKVKTKVKAGVAKVKTKVKAGVAKVAKAFGIKGRREGVKLGNGEPHTLTLRKGQQFAVDMASDNPGPLKLVVRNHGAPQDVSSVIAAYDAARAAVAAASPDKRDQVAAKHFSHIKELVAQLRGAPSAAPAGSVLTPPTLGQVAVHRSNSPGTRSGGDARLHMESEHVIPVSWVSLLLKYRWNGAKIERGSSIDLNMHTVRIYATAAKRKTRDDMRVLRRLSAFLEHGTVNNLSTKAGQRRQRKRDEQPLVGGQRPVTEKTITVNHSDADGSSPESKTFSREQFRKQAIEGFIRSFFKTVGSRKTRTTDAIKADFDTHQTYRGEKSPQPDAGCVDGAMNLQINDIKLYLAQNGWNV